MSCGNKSKLYSEEEDTFIREHYTTTPHRIIADTLGRTVKSIRNRARKIGCDGCFRKTEWTKSEDAVVLSAQGRTLESVAKELQRHPTEVSKRARKLGVKSWRRPNGEPVTIRGYVVSRFDNGKPVYEHRDVIEGDIGRKLKDTERVHHIDLNKRNNSRNNLHLFESPRQHALAHGELCKLCGTDAQRQRELLRMGFVYFDRTGGTYKCATKA